MKEVELVRKGVVVGRDLDRELLTSRLRGLRLLGVAASKRGARWRANRQLRCKVTLAESVR